MKKSKEPSEVRHPEKAFTWKSGILFAIGIALLVGILSFIGPKNVYEALTKMSLQFVILVSFFSLIMFAIEALSFRKIVQILGLVRLRDIIPIHLGGMLINTLTPGARTGGEFVKAYYISKLTKHSGAKSLGMVTLNSVIYGGVFCTIAFGSVGVIAVTKGFPVALVSGLLLVICFFLAAVLFSLWLYKKGGSVLKKRWLSPLVKFAFKLEKKRKEFKNYSYKRYLKYKINWIDEFINTTRLILLRKDLVVSASILQAIACFVYFIEVYFIAQGLGLNVGIVPIILVTSVSMLFGYFMFLPGGIGVVEASMIYLYPLFGVSPAAAAAITLVDRAIYYLVVFGGGYASLMWLGWKYNVKSQRSS